MGYCIYYKTSEPKVNFTKREHVIPAGLGGIAKLPLGCVSDEANESFSPLEREVLRNSFIAVNRTNVGPGKRGSLNVNKVKTPTIRVLKDSNIYGDNYKLGFVFAGESYIITQTAIDFNDKENYYNISFYSTVFDMQQSKQIISDFRKYFIQFLLNKNRDFKLIDMPYHTDKHFINIGCHKGKWFAMTSHKVINMDYLALMLLPAVMAEEFKHKEPMELPKSLLQHTYKIDINASAFYFIFVKTAFNALAFLKGSDFVCEEMFDDVRKRILSHDDLSDFIVNDESTNILVKDIIDRIPDKAHYVIITSTFDSVLAYVSFYNEKPPAIIKLTNHYNGEVFTDAIICDWKNRNEFTLNQLK